MTRPKHTHRYQRVEWGKNGTLVWRCTLPNCHHYLHREMILNQASICHECGNEFILTLEKLRRVKPRCDDCVDGKKDGTKEIDDMLDDLMKGDL
jgi:ssDNA-binding Zn-finger/Zn-ribbon topoisomerase 1